MSNPSSSRRRISLCNLLLVITMVSCVMASFRFAITFDSGPLFLFATLLTCLWAVWLVGWIRNGVHEGFKWVLAGIIVLLAATAISLLLMPQIH